MLLLILVTSVRFVQNPSPPHTLADPPLKIVGIMHMRLISARMEAVWNIHINVVVSPALTDVDGLFLVVGAKRRCKHLRSSVDGACSCL